MFMSEPRNLNIAAITRGGVTTRVEWENPQEQMQPQVRSVAQKKESSIGLKYKEVF